MITGNEPINPMGDQSCREPSNGLTIRQQFAMVAMQGLCGLDKTIDPKAIAQASIMCADALINELNESEK